ncbi:glycosyltransferase family 2 protein [Cohnella abietis]|nr:glycosyltransferase family 2 protein [Cohnella abietis]
MIVRNEEEILERCLQSVTGLVDEIVIIDTGSSDSTKKIAAQYTSKIFDLDWTQDFSVARNESIARATGEWILVLDADEYMDSSSFTTLLTFLQNHRNRAPIGIILPIYNFVGAHNSGKISQSKAMRLFTRHPDLMFVRPIHEQLKLVNGNLTEFELEIPIYHSGYIEEAIKSKQKTKRNDEIFQQMRNQGRLTPYDSFTLGNEYMAQDLYEEALSFYLDADQPSEQYKSWLPNCKGARISCLMKLHQYTEAYEQIQLAINRWTGVCDFYWLEGYLYAQLGMDKEAILSLERCIAIAEKKSEHPTYLISPNYGSTLPLQQLYVLYSRSFDLQKTVFCLTKLCYANPTNQSALLQLTKLIITPEQYDQVQSLIQSLYPLPTSSQLTMIVDVFIQLGHKPLSEIYWNNCRVFNIELPLEVKLKYYLLHEDWSLFQQTLVQESEERSANWDFSIYCAAIVWPQHAAELYALLSPEFDSNPANVASVCLYLFRTGQYNQYDELIQRHEEHLEDLANILGGAFYEDRQYELALDYYSLLLKQETLSAKGFENLARLYFMQEETNEGLQFVEKALELLPERIELYMMMLTQTVNSHHKMQIKSRLIKAYPGLLHFPKFPL